MLQIIIWVNVEYILFIQKNTDQFFIYLYLS